MKYLAIAAALLAPLPAQAWTAGEAVATAPAPGGWDRFNEIAAGLGMAPADLLLRLMADPTISYSYHYATGHSYRGTLAEYARDWALAGGLGGQGAARCSSYRNEWGDYYGYYPDRETGTYIPGCDPATGRWTEEYLDYLNGLSGGWGRHVYQ